MTACLVWKDWPYRVHPHGLVGKDCSNGLCEVVLKPQTNPKHRYTMSGRVLPPAESCARPGQGLRTDTLALAYAEVGAGRMKAVF